MPVKMRLAKARRFKMTDEIRVKAVRLLLLEAAHTDAIRGDDRSFYEDGRHEELVALMAEVYPALAIMPWNDSQTILRAALGTD